MLSLLGMLSWFGPALIGAWFHQRLSSEVSGFCRILKYSILWLLTVNSLASLITVRIFGYQAGVFASLCTVPSFILKYAAVGIFLVAFGIITLYVWQQWIQPFLKQYGIEDLPSLPQQAGWKLCLAIALILIALNMLRIFDNNFWSDECFTIMLSQMSLPEMLSATASDVHPPLYYLVTMVAYRLFGNVGWAYHGASLLAYIGLMAFALTWFWRRYGTTCCIVFMTMTSLMPQAFCYNVEVRMYAQAALFTCLSFACFYNIVEKSRRSDYVIFTIVSLCAAYTHYYALITVGFLYVALLVLVATKRLRWRPVALVYAATVSIYLPWFIVLLRTFSRISDSYWIVYYPSVHQSLDYVFEMDSAWGGVVMQACFVLLFATALGRGISVVSEKGKGKLSFSNQTIWLLAGLGAVLGTILTGVLVSMLIRPVFILRYLYPACVLIWMSFACLLNQFPARRLLCMVVVALLLVTQLPADLMLFEEERRQNQLLSATLENVSPDEDTVILTDNEVQCDSLLRIYYPENKRVQLDTGTNYKLDPNKKYLLFLMNEVGEEVQDWLIKQGLRCNDEPYQGWMGKDPVYAYRLERLKNINMTVETA